MQCPYICKSTKWKCIVLNYGNMHIEKGVVDASVPLPVLSLHSCPCSFSYWC